MDSSSLLMVHRDVYIWKMKKDTPVESNQEKLLSTGVSSSLCLRTRGRVLALRARVRVDGDDTVGLLRVHFPGV